MKKPLFLLLSLLLLSFTSALEMSANIDSTIIVKDFNNPVEFNVTITNITPGKYNLYTLADVNLEPREIFEWQNGTIIKTITITPTPNLNTNSYYTFTYILNHRDVEKIEEQLTINLIDLEDIIEIGSDSINTEESLVRFYIQNNENVLLENITATFSSVLFTTTQTFDLKPNQKKYITATVNEEKLATTKAGVYKIDAIFQTLNGEKEIEGNIYIGETKNVTTTGDKSGFLIQTETVTKINTGNVVETVPVEITKNFISRLFTSFTIEPLYTERTGSKIKYTWVKNSLDPNETYTIKAKTNYIFPILVIILAIMAIVGFKRWNEKKIEIDKSVTHVKTKSGEFALKIKLQIKAKRAIENVTIIDKVPAIVKIYNKFGTLKPDKIDPESRRLHWHLGDLSSGEVRVLSYIVYSKVGIVGKFSLPEAVSVFESEGRIHETTSNNVFFLSNQVKG